MAGCAEFPEPRQGIVEPDDAGMGVLLAGFAEPAGFHGDDFPALSGKPVGVPAAAGADVAGETRLSVFQESWRPGAMDDFRVMGVVLLEQRVPVLVVVGGAAQGALLAAFLWPT